MTIFRRTEGNKLTKVIIQLVAFTRLQRVLKQMFLTKKFWVKQCV